MKFIAPISRFISGSVSMAETGCLLWPDSCMLPSGRPLFLPDFAQDFRAVPAFAVKITRLGKCVAPKFAHRYFTSFSPAFLLLPQAAFDSLGKGVCPPPDDYCFDSSVVTGDWFPATGMTEFSASLSLISNEFSLQNNFSLSVNVIYEAISLASLRSTLKIGDIILIPFPDKEVAPIENSSLSISILSGSSPALVTKFK